ncbi:hypothetical protein [Nostoc sp.]
MQKVYVETHHTWLKERSFCFLLKHFAVKAIAALALSSDLI